MDQSNTGIVLSRIENIRPRLLDLTRRNPLLAMKLSERSNSFVRIIDEEPNFLLSEIARGEMRIIPLPDLEEDLKDEDTRDFQNLLIAAKLNDETYIKDIENVDQTTEESEEKSRQALRRLKDRLRGQMGLPKRQTQNSLSLQQHAQNHQIDPSYELTSQSTKHKDGRHDDQDIQTLLLPSALQRRLKALKDKDNSWKAEAGIPVLHATFGALEWKEDPNASLQYSPLVLVQIELEEKKTSSGSEFWISAENNIPTANLVLAEKLRIEFGIELPIFNPDSSLEEYFKKISDMKPRGVHWELRRWGAIGVFPSAKLAMYKDLEPGLWDFHNHTVLSSLFGGSSVKEASPLQEEYDVDQIEIESKIPFLVADADSSQFSALVDIANEKNLAVEGPPGTGKSQTIVNTIAAAIGEGKKVLFVAEKSAALEVVRNRLNAWGLGDFILSLQASHSSRQDVIDSIRSRMIVSERMTKTDYEDTLADYKKTRDKLNSYINILSQSYGKTELSVYDILSKNIKYSTLREKLSNHLQKKVLPNVDSITQEHIKAISFAAEEIRAGCETVKNLNSVWISKIKNPNLNPFTAEEILELTLATANAFSDFKENIETLKQFDIDYQEIVILESIKSCLGNLPRDIDYQCAELSERIFNTRKDKTFSKYMRIFSKLNELKTRLDKDLRDPFNQKNPKILIDLRNLSNGYNLVELSVDSISSLIKSREVEISAMTEILNFYYEVEKISPPLKTQNLSNLVKLHSFLRRQNSSLFSMRDEKYLDFRNRMEIKKASEIASNLLIEREELKKFFFMPAVPSAEEILECFLSFKSSGIFSIFSNKYNKIKKTYKSFSTSEKFSKELAAKSLQKLHSWLEAKEKFSQNQRIKILIDDDFSDLETDFSLYLALVEFYKDVEDAFSHTNEKDLLDFIFKSDSNLLKVVSSLKISEEVVSSSKKDHGYESTLEKLDVLRKSRSDLENLKNLLIEANKEIFISENHKSVSKLKALIQDLNSLNSTNEELFCLKEELMEVFSNNLQDSQESLQEISMALRVIEAVSKIEEDKIKLSVFKSLKTDNGFSLNKVLLEFFHRKARLDEQIDSLAQLTNTQTLEWTFKSIDEGISILERAAKDKQGLLASSRIYSAIENLKHYGFQPFEEGLISSEQNEDLSEILLSILFFSMGRDLYSKHAKILNSYDGTKLSILRKRLQKVDRELIDRSRLELRKKLIKSAKPKDGNSKGKVSTYTEKGLLYHVGGLSKRLPPVRNLVLKAGYSLQEYKPCWMMSPLAVAQYIPKDSVEFDLVIIDEASQMTPENAIGALVRSKQAMVVGDTNQLPPTSFFNSLLDEDPESLEDEESILEMANCRFPRRRLRWHYRSRHSGLISFSNQYIYNSNLIVFPSASEGNPNMGVFYHKVEGFYNSGINVIEAKEMVDSILNFMMNNIDESLGVVVLNQKQRDLLIEEMNYAFDKNSEAIKYKEIWESKNNGLESFFIKNLENVQGDERDVIFIGTVYGPEKFGAKVMQRFGPINGVGGKRRLNVLFSRAKKRIVTFSSMTANDITSEESGNPGAFMLKKWLEYCATGILESGLVSGNEPDSEFEEHVIERIISMGFIAIPQVGVKGYSIDIGIKHPSWDHGFIMGVECDGATYHSSKSARDRDRLRQEVLENLGWKLHRIWSTDWFEDPKGQVQKLRISLENRLKELIG